MCVKVNACHSPTRFRVQIQYFRVCARVCACVYVCVSVGVWASASASASASAVCVCVCGLRLHFLIEKELFTRFFNINVRSCNYINVEEMCASKPLWTPARVEPNVSCFKLIALNLQALKSTHP